MDITFNIRDHKGEIELVFGVRVNNFSWAPSGVSGDIDILDVRANGFFVPGRLEDEFIEMIGYDEIAQRALEKESDARIK